jgi:hypothetical protein
LNQLQDVALDPRKYDDVNNRETVEMVPQSHHLQKIANNYNKLVNNIDTAFDKKDQPAKNYMKISTPLQRFKNALHGSISKKLSGVSSFSNLPSVNSPGFRNSPGLKIGTVEQTGIHKSKFGSLTRDSGSK